MLGVILAGCATPQLAQRAAAPKGELFPQDQETVWEASLKGLAQYPKRDIKLGEGLILTDWVYGYADRQQGFLVQDQVRRRERFKVQVQAAPGGGTEVAVRSVAEERPTRGSASLYWRRVPPSSEAIGYLIGQIRKTLEEGAPAPTAPAPPAP